MREGAGGGTDCLVFLSEPGSTEDISLTVHRSEAARARSRERCEPWSGFG